MRYLFVCVFVACSVAPPEDPGAPANPNAFVPEASTGGSSGSSGGTSTGTTGIYTGQRLTRLRGNREPVSDNPDPLGSWMFQDAALNTTCAFAPVSETDMRCVPNGVSPATELYTDENCTAYILAVSSAACQNGEYFALTTPANTPALNAWYGGIDTIVQEGPTFTPLRVYQRIAGGCVDMSEDFLGGTYTFFEPNYFDDSSFAHGTFSEVTSASGALKRPRIITDENLVLENPFGGEAYDTALQDECVFSASDMPCAPANLAELQDVETHACSVAAVGVPAASAALAFGSYDYSVYAITRTQKAVDVSAPDSCEDLGSFDIYSLGAEQTLPAGTNSHYGSGRVQEDQLSVDSFALFLGYWDSEVNAACTLTLTDTGDVRCITGVVPALRRYQDNACKQPVAEYSTPQTPAIVALPDEGCDNMMKLYIAAGAASVSVPYLLTPAGACVAASADPVGAEFIYFGGEVPATNYPLVDGE